jgi:hypoxanthine phosphoribosyltransferase
MAGQITILEKQFEVYIKSDEIQKRVKEIAQALNEKFAGKTPLFLSILNGSFIFTSDLMKHITLECEISFIKLASYSGTTSSGTITTLIGLSESLKGKDIVVIEDIVDTGRTMKNLLAVLNEHSPQSISIVTLLFKKEALIEKINPDLAGFIVPDKFLVGYGLDYNNLGRNQNDIFVAV